MRREGLGILLVEGFRVGFDVLVNRRFILSLIGDCFIARTKRDD